MKSARIRTSALAAAAALTLPLSLGVLASQASAASPSPSPSVSPFGPGCSSLPQNGSGSAVEMAKERVATAIANNPELSELNDAIKKANLTTTLDDLKGSTVFAPTNDAFNKLGTAKKDALLNNPTQLKKVLRYHVVEHKTITKADLPNGDFTTLEGSKITTSGSGTSFKVNGSAPITCGDITTKNATVYIVDGILIPPTATATPSPS
ncbi:fasciclin domain-containing protein [Streptomyces sp. NPDC058001]|uniref:fasciclin domain-containing protein n=1 Tax=Streptomyces sp. NPDC058001 TaxID=3346300 RepID=UPI0036E77DF7